MSEHEQPQQYRSNSNSNSNSISNTNNSNNEIVMDLRRRNNPAVRLSVPRSALQSSLESKKESGKSLPVLFVIGSMLIAVILLLAPPLGTPLNHLYSIDDAVAHRDLMTKEHYQIPLVCSHQVLNPPKEDTTTSASSTATPADGSLDAMTALWKAGGVTCFDIDVIVLSDGSMVASHPRRLKAAVEEQLHKNNHDNNNDNDEVVLEEFTLESLMEVLGLAKPTAVRGSNNNNNNHSPFPIFDKEVLPHFAELVAGIPGAFSVDNALPESDYSIIAPPWDLRGRPLLNIDLKQGPYLTEDRVLELAVTIHELGLEDAVAICATAPPPVDIANNNNNNNGGDGAGSFLDLLEVFHNHNRASNVATKKNIPVGLVLRDLVEEDADVDRVREVVEVLYPETIRSLVPSFKFSNDWYRGIRDPNTSSSSQQQTARMTKSTTTKNPLWKLPMTVWTIDSQEDYQVVSSVTTTITITDDQGQEHESRPFPMASAVVANSPMELIH